LNRVKPVVNPQFLVDGVEEDGLFHGVQPVIANVSSDEGGIPLLHEPVVILVVGAAAGEGDSREAFLQEADEVPVDKFAAVVGVEFLDGERDAGKDVGEGIL